MDDREGKRLLFAFWRAEDKQDSPYQNWYLPLKKIFKDISVFDAAQFYFKHGKKMMNELFIDKVSKEKPDFIFIDILYDEFEIDTFYKVRDISPKTIIINLFSDDDWRFENFSRYYAKFFDYSIILHDLREKYREEGYRDANFFIGVNCDNFKPIPAKKEISVSFFGRPNAGRSEKLRHLIRNKIDLTLFGDGWGNEEEFKGIYKGHLNAVELVKMINECKINLGFTLNNLGRPQIKGRPFEIMACRSFALIEYFKDYKKYFKEGKEIIFFRSEKDMVKKIRYYLGNEKEREEIADNSYKRVLKDYNQEKHFRRFFSKHLRRRKYEDEFLEEVKVAKLKKEDLELSIDKLKSLIKGERFISIKDGDCEDDRFKDNLLSYSIDKTEKGIAICDYYVSNRSLGDYLLFKASFAFNNLDRKTFNQMIDINQMMFSKDFFLRNLKKIKSFLQDKDQLISEENSSFVSIPLIRLSRSPVFDDKTMEKAFGMKFLDKIFSLFYNKDPKIFGYLSSLLIQSVRCGFIRKELAKSMFNKEKLKKIKNL